MDYWTKITNNTFGKPDDYHPSWYDWETKEAEERNAIYEEKQRKIEEVRRQREISEKRNLHDKAVKVCSRNMHVIALYVFRKPIKRK